MNNRRKLLLSAVSERFRELCDERIRSLKPEDFGEQLSFVSEVQQQFSNASSEQFQEQQLQPTDTWQQSELTGLPALRALALGNLGVTSSGETPAGGEFLDELKTARKDASQSLQLMMKRYACPLNFACATEDDIREFVLAGLMVQDRRTIEEDSLSSADNDYLWYRLSLIALHSQASPDLRFLDALSHYFELIPAGWRPRAQNNWLMVSYLSLYARALAVKCEDFKCA